MASLKLYNGRYCESEYEDAFISFLEDQDWIYIPGASIPREDKKEVIYIDDLEDFLNKTHSELTIEEVHSIIDTVRLAGADSDFSTLHKVYGWLVNGIQFTPQNGVPEIIDLIDFEKPANNNYRVVNQFTVEYTNNGQTENRRPDILLFVNGIPLCVIELKNPADEKATI